MSREYLCPSTVMSWWTIAGTGFGIGVGRFVTSAAAGRGFSVFSAGTFTSLTGCSFAHVSWILEGVRLRVCPSSEDLYLIYPIFREQKIASMEF